MKNLQKIEVMEIGSKLVDLNQETFTDEGTDYEIFVAEDGSWIAEDDALGEWVQVKGGRK